MRLYNLLKKCKAQNNMIVVYQNKYWYRLSSYTVLYFGTLNDFRIELNQTATKFIPTYLGSDITRHFRIIFVKHID